MTESFILGSDIQCRLTATLRAMKNNGANQKRKDAHSLPVYETPAVCQVLFWDQRNAAVRKYIKRTALVELTL